MECVSSPHWTTPSLLSPSPFVILSGWEGDGLCAAVTFLSFFFLQMGKETIHLSALLKNLLTLSRFKLSLKVHFSLPQIFCV